MGARTVNVGEDVEGALNFLAAQEKLSATEYFVQEVNKVCAAKLAEADEKRFAMASDILAKVPDKGEAVSKLRDLLGV